MAKFKIGEKVKVVGPKSVCGCGWVGGMNKFIGSTYAVKDVVELRKDAYYFIECGYAFLFKECTLESAEGFVIPEGCSVWTDGKTVKLTDNATGETAVANCSPEDKFDLETGIKIAHKRLKKQISQTYLNCDVVCIETGHRPSAYWKLMFERGKKYTFKNGVIEHCEDGGKWPDESYSPGYGPRKEFDECLRRFFVKIEQEHPEAPQEFKDPYSTCTFIALKDHDELHAGHVYHVQDHVARDGSSWKIEFENNEIGCLQASKIVQVIKEG